jgi:hypothetical protein
MPISVGGIWDGSMLDGVVQGDAVRALRRQRVLKVTETRRWP